MVGEELRWADEVVCERVEGNLKPKAHKKELVERGFWGMVLELFFSPNFLKSRPSFFWGVGGKTIQKNQITSKN